MMLRLSVSLAVALAVCDFAPAIDPSDWTQWRGNSRDSQLIDASLPEKLEGNLELVWEKPHQPSYSGPITFDGLLYTTETVDKKFERVTAYRLDTGEVEWTTQWEGSMSVPFFAAANGDWIRATPAVTEAGLIVVGMRDVMYCLDPKTGQTKWSVDFPNEMGTQLPAFGAACSPLIDGDAVFMQTGGATVRLSMADGSVVWQTLANSGMQSGGAFSSPIIATIAGKRQLLVQTRLELCGVELETGEVLWRQPIEAYRGMNILTPLPIGDRIFTSAHSGKAQMYEISNTGGQWAVKLVWEQERQAYMSSPVLVGNRIFLHMRNDRMTALDTATGDPLFTTRPIGKYASMIADGKRILALTDGGDLILVDGTASEFELIDKLSVANDSWAHLAISGDYLIVRDLKAIKVYKMKG